MSATAHYPHTYYSDSVELPSESSPLRGSARADVCVVGGGIAGCSAALALAERGYSVVLLEAHRIGWGASGRSGGQVLPGLALDQDALQRLAGAADARRLWQLSVEAVALVRERIGRHHIACEWTAGHLTAAIKQRQWRSLQDWQRRLVGDYGYEGTELLEGAALRAAVNSERYLGGLWDPHSGHLHPLRYTLGLAHAARERGARIHEASVANHYGRGGDALQVRTSAGEVRCGQLLFAGNAWLGATVPALARKLVPIRASMLATEPLGAARAQGLIPSNAAVSDTNWVLDYFRRSSDHRLLFGGPLSYSGMSLRAIGAAGTRRMLRVFPQLAGVRTDCVWDCLLDLTASRAPQFGRLAPDVYYLQGFSGHGLALAGLAGTLLAAAIAGDAERFDVFARLPQPDFPGGRALRRPLLALAMLWYRLRDLL